MNVTSRNPAPEVPGPFTTPISTMAAERTANVHVHEGVTEEAFVAMRTARDKTLDMPDLILPSVQVNMNAGHLPEPEENGTRYLKIPLNSL